MTSSDFEKRDLSDLIHAAQAEAEGRPAAGKTTTKRRESGLKPLLFLGVLLVLVAFCGAWLWRDMRPASRAQVTADLEHVLLKARESVESFRADTGKLPQALPNAALSSVVKYQPVRDKYVLIARSGGVHLVLFSDRDKPVQAGGR
jgi:hypothetical protein